MRSPLPRAATTAHVTLSLGVGLALLGWTPAARAWGDKGHEMTARVAARKLPRDMPAFFRNAEVELGYLCPEPDRWRNEKREPALKGLADRDHVWKREDVTPPLPPNRYEFLAQHVGRPRSIGEGTLTFRDLGFAPYAIAEAFEKVTVGFMLWRKAPEKTSEERRIKRQIEQNLVHVAGVAAHFVTDLGMPLHTSIHGDGWDERRAPNPRGFTGRGKSLHRRFETDYVNAEIAEADFESLVGQPRPRVEASWLDAALAHIDESHAQVRRLYELDTEAPFGAGGETPAHKRFVSERLAFAASALRDFWYAAWLRSATLPENPTREPWKKPARPPGKPSRSAHAK
jgi:hypothetical protein